MSESSKTEHEKAIERIMAYPYITKCGAWSKEDLDILKKLYPKKTAQYIAEKMGRSKAAIHSRACISGIKKSIAWSSQEKKLLKKLWSKKSPSDIAKIIERSVSAIINKAYILGLSTRNKRK